MWFMLAPELARTSPHLLLQEHGERGNVFTQSRAAANVSKLSRQMLGHLPRHLRAVAELEVVDMAVNIATGK
jgi:hypothetical protein